MINRKSTFVIGLFVLLIPFLGLPSSWKTALIIVSGFSLLIISVKISLPKKNIKTKTKREKITPVFVENAPMIKEVHTRKVEKPKVPSDINYDQIDIQ